jgi:hypothetical protein
MGARVCKRLGYEQLSASLALQGASHVYFPSPPRSCRAPSILAFYDCWPWSRRALSDGRLRWRGRETSQRMGAGRMAWPTAWAAAERTALGVAAGVVRVRFRPHFGRVNKPATHVDHSFKLRNLA